MPLYCNDSSSRGFVQGCAVAGVVLFCCSVGLGSPTGWLWESHCIGLMSNAADVAATTKPTVTSANTSVLRDTVRTYRASNTGTGDWWITRWATEPRSMLPTAPMPRVPMAIWSTCRSFAVRTISLAITP